MAESTVVNLNRFLPKLRCLRCEGNIHQFKSIVKCKKCNTIFPLPGKKAKVKANESLGEKIFDIPILYNLKIRLLNSINRLQIPIDPLVKNKEILDIGCGSYQVRYNPSAAKLRIGIDPSEKALVKAQQLYPNSIHVVGSADKLPLKNKSVDITLILFTFHHLNGQQWINCLEEIERVTKNKIIIYDHISSDSPILKIIQHLYWKTFDGGHTYPHESEWKDKLKKFKIKKYLRVGSMFKHIGFFEIDLKK